MGQLQTFTDLSGQMDPLAIHGQTINQLLEESNRNADQLDSLVRSLNIIGRGSISLSWPGTVGAAAASAVHGQSFAPVFMATFVRSDQPTVSYPVQSDFYDGLGNHTAQAVAHTDATAIYVAFISSVAGAPLTFVFSYYILQQPAQLPGS